MSIDQTNRLKNRAAAASVAFNLGSTALKLTGAVLTGSVALLSEGVHSLTDVVASTIALVSVRAAAAPPDEEHPYGHGKIESLAGFAESILLLFAVVLILIQSAGKLRHGAEVQRVDLGMALMAASALGSVIVGLYVSRVARQTESLALQSNGQHLMVDSVTSAGVLAALAITRFTGWQEADAVVAILLVLWIGWNAWRLCYRAFHELIDRRLPAEELELVRKIAEATEGCLSFHHLRSRLSGNVRHIDLHIVVPNHWSVVQAHDLADHLEKEIEQKLTPSLVVVHVDPYDESKEHRRNME